MSIHIITYYAIIFDCLFVFIIYFDFVFFYLGNRTNIPVFYRRMKYGCEFGCV